MKRIFILALDGTPYTFLEKILSDGVMPNLAQLAGQSQFLPMDSVLPPLSSVAWASFMTGTLPAEHKIFGFVERDPQTMEWFVPMSDQLKLPTLWDKLSAAGKRVFIMNVPLTYPPKKVNGILICGFLGTDISKGTYPPEIGPLLKARDYRIDSDVELAKKDLGAFYDQLGTILEKRIETMWHFWQQENWDFFMTHIMETDRLHHFFWEYMENGHPQWSAKFYEFYHRIDQIIGRIREKLAPHTALMILSDHGFTRLKKEVYLNRWLWENGFLRFTTANPQSLKEIHPQSLAYSLYPGRLYLNLQGREKTGSVRPGSSFIELRQHLKSALLSWVDPESNQPIIDKIYLGEEIFEKRDGKILSTAVSAEIDHRSKKYPDLMVIAKDGYDLKGNLWREKLFEKSLFNGMHTLQNAFVLVQNGKLPAQRLSIADLAGYILEYLEVN